MSDQNPYDAPKAAPMTSEDSNNPDIQRKANPLLWAGAVITLVIYNYINISVVSASGQKDSTENMVMAIGTVIGSLFWPVVAVSVSSISKKNKNPATRAKVFFIASLVLLLITVLTILTVH